MIALVAAWRARDRITDQRLRSLLFLLLGTIIAARARRMFQHVEWYHTLLEVPTYALLLHVLLPYEPRVRRRCVRSLMVPLAALSILGYWLLGRGALTQRGWEGGVATPHGTIHMSKGEREDYLRLSSVFDDLDPSRTRPLFAFAYEGGFSYFFGRKNATALTQGFYFTALSSTAREQEKLEEAGPAPLLLDHLYLDGVSKVASLSNLVRWLPKTQSNVYHAVDRPIFNRIAAGCLRVRKVSAYTVYDCPAAESSLSR